MNSASALRAKGDDPQIPLITQITQTIETKGEIDDEGTLREELIYIVASTGVLTLKIRSA